MLLACVYVRMPVCMCVTLFAPCSFDLTVNLSPHTIQVKNPCTDKVIVATLLPLTDTVALLQLVSGDGIDLPLLPRSNGHGKVGKVPEDLEHWQVGW